MTQKISYEDAFPTFQKKCSELFEANMLLQAQVDVLGQRNEMLEQEKTSLEEQVRVMQLQHGDTERQQGPAVMDQTPQPLSPVDPDALG